MVGSKSRLVGGGAQGRVLRTRLALLCGVSLTLALSHCGALDERDLQAAGGKSGSSGGSSGSTSASGGAASAGRGGAANNSGGAISTEGGVGGSGDTSGGTAQGGLDTGTGGLVGSAGDDGNGGVGGADDGSGGLVGSGGTSAGGTATNGGSGGKATSGGVTGSGGKATGGATGSGGASTGGVTGYTFTALGYPSSSDVEGEAMALSADGTTVVGWSRPVSGEALPFRWNGTTYAKLPVPSDAIACKPDGVSGNGAAVVGDCESSSGGGPGTIIGFRWTAGATESLGVMNLGSFSHATAISSDGTFVAGFGDQDGEPKALRWTSLNGFAIQTFGGIDFMVPFASSSNGSVLAGVRSATGDGISGYSIGSSGPTKFSGGTFTDLGNTTGFSGGAVLALSTDGAIAAGFQQEGTVQRATRWTGVTAQDLGTLGGNSVGAAITADGAIIVGSSNGRAMIWDATNGMRLLSTVLTNGGVNLAGWTLQNASGISSNGKVIAGTGLHGSKVEPWLARLP